MSRRHRTVAQTVWVSAPDLPLTLAQSSPGRNWDRTPVTTGLAVEERDTRDITLEFSCRGRAIHIIRPDRQ